MDWVKCGETIAQVNVLMCNLVLSLFCWVFFFFSMMISLLGLLLLLGDLLVCWVFILYHDLFVGSFLLYYDGGVH